MDTTTTPHTYQVKRAWLINPDTGRATRRQCGWNLTRDGAPFAWFLTRQQARDGKKAALAMDTHVAALNAAMEARAARRARLHVVLTALCAFVACVVVVLGMVPMQPEAIAAPAAHPIDAVHVARVLAIPADVAFRAVFIAQ